MAALSVIARELPRFLFLLLGCAAAVLVAGIGMSYPHAIDWSMLEVAVVCVMPAFVVADIFAIAVTVWAAIRGQRALFSGVITPRQARTDCSWLSILAFEHVMTAALAAMLLAIPSLSILAGPFVAEKMRGLLLALATLGFVEALTLPSAVAGPLLSLLGRNA